MYPSPENFGDWRGGVDEISPGKLIGIAW